MRFIILVLFLISSSVSAARPQWTDVEIGQNYKLTHDFVFPNNFKVPRGQAVRATELRGLGIGLVLLEVEVTNCTFPELELEVELFYVPTEIGMTVQPGCLLWFYVENQDIYTEAPLE